MALPTLHIFDEPERSDVSFHTGTAITVARYVIA